MLRTADLDYHLPEELIATEPASPRDSARLMVLRRSDPDFLAHRRVSDLPEFLVVGDLLVVNRTHVLPARFRGVRTDTGGKAEGLFVQELPGGVDCSLVWQVLLKLRRAKPGVIVRALHSDGTPGPIHLRLISRIGAESGDDTGGWRVAVEGHDAGATTRYVLERIGLTPLPPYILAARRRHDEASGIARDRHDREVYQTVYAAADEQESHGRGSVAAPTAGLHFTPDLLSRLNAGGVDRTEVVLHVGMGTFKPVETEFVERHAMHGEWCEVPPETAHRLQRAPRASGGSGSSATTPHTFAKARPLHSSAESPSTPAPHSRPPTVIAVGTTTARTLESFASPDEMLATPAKETRLLITPGHHFRHVGALLTNFHLPRSTLLAMVAAFLDDDDRVRGSGLARLLSAYRTAVETGYRFYSFGDAMIILP